ncbi:MAG: Uma2 family endonuclease [Chloroflexota bacterium]
MVIEAGPRLFTVDEYYRMAEAGILDEDERVELIEGEIIQMSPIGPPHNGGVIKLTRLFGERFEGRALLAVQAEVRLDRRNQVHPDIALLRSREDYYRARHPSSADVHLIVEVAQSSLPYDLGQKAQLYARGGVLELWVMDVVGERLVVHRDPGPDGYASVTVLGLQERVAPLAFPEDLFEVTDLFP